MCEVTDPSVLGGTFHLPIYPEHTSAPRSWFSPWLPFGPPFPVIWLQARSTPSLLIRGANGQNLFWQKVWIPSPGHVLPGVSRPHLAFSSAPRRAALGCPRRASWVLEQGSIAPPAALVTAPQLRESRALVKVAERCIKGSKYTHPAQWAVKVVNWFLKLC